LYSLLQLKSVFLNRFLKCHIIHLTVASVVVEGQETRGWGFGGKERGGEQQS
jgi:hypothetical protein